MVRYFFNVYDGEASPDEEGTEFADLASARHEAVVSAAAMLGESSQQFWDGPPWRMEVTNEDQEVVLLLRFSATTAEREVDAERR